MQVKRSEQHRHDLLPQALKATWFFLERYNNAFIATKAFTDAVLNDTDAGNRL
ncbi:MAG: hypothetical protein ACLT4C_09590 [Butyricicoccus sp.]